MRESISSIYSALAGLIIGLTHDQIFVKQFHLPESAAIPDSILLAFFIIVVYEFVGGRRAFMKRFLPISKVAGAWRIYTGNSDRPTSVCSITLLRRGYVYHGVGINRDGTVGSTWTSRDVHYDEDQDELSFTSDATLREDGSRIRNYGYVKFYRNAKNKFEYGNGYFVDMGKNLTQNHMTLVRIKESEFDEIVTTAFDTTRNCAPTVEQSTEHLESLETISP